MLLTLTLSITLLAIITVFFINYNNYFLIRYCALFFSGLTLVLSTLIIFFFNKNYYHFQNVVSFNVGSDLVNTFFVFGLDGISLFFFFLTTLLTFLCILFIWKDLYFKQNVLLLFVIQFFLLIIFSILDLFLFYIFFEAILMPMYILIGFSGSRSRKVRAAYLFFFYTLCGSIFMLAGIIYIYINVGSLNLEYLLNWNFSWIEQNFLWLAFFLAFASKIPLFPFHIWLPEAHVEAPTVGSVLLAGILLKLGVYGFIRFSITLFPEASLFFSPFVYLLSILGVLYASITAIRQTDLKRIIAYSSVAHMNLVSLGLFSFNLLGLEGAILQSISHGFVSGGIFLLIGIIYDRYHTRFLYYYGGLVHLMPMYSAFLLLFILANIALPGTSSFVGEFLLLCGIFKVNVLLCVISTISVILGGAYSLWLYNRIVFGNIKFNYTIQFSDMDLRETIIIFSLIIFIFLIGINPVFFFSFFHLAIHNLSFNFF